MHDVVSERERVTTHGWGARLLSDRDDDGVRLARRRDGRWSTYAAYPGRYWFQLEQRGPSRWNTARALLVLEWWQASPGH